jgi:hypothetical protein
MKQLAAAILVVLAAGAAVLSDAAADTARSGPAVQAPKGN